MEVRVSGEWNEQQKIHQGSNVRKCISGRRRKYVNKLRTVTGIATTKTLDYKQLTQPEILTITLGEVRKNGACVHAPSPDLCVTYEGRQFRLPAARRATFTMKLPLLDHICTKEGLSAITDHLWRLITWERV